MKLEDYDPEFYAMITSDDKRYLSYRCFSCNHFHLVRSTAKEIKRIRRSYRMVKSTEGILILHCGKKEIPKLEDDGLNIIINPKNKLSKKERDKIRKRIQRTIERIPNLYVNEELILSAKEILSNKLSEYRKFEKKLNEAKKQLIVDLHKLRKEIGDHDKRM